MALSHREPALEPFLPLPAAAEEIPLAREVRSTWIASSVMALKDKGYFDAYLTRLPARYHEQVLSPIAGQWLPIETAMAHYTACGELDFTRQQIWDMGVVVTQRVHRSSVAFALRVVREAGVGPWTIFGQMQTMWDRVWRGGAVGVYKLGPKEARVDIVRWPPARLRYVRLAMPAVLHGLTELFCTRAFVSEVGRACTEEALALKVAWA